MKRSPISHRCLQLEVAALLLAVAIAPVNGRANDFLSPFLSAVAGLEMEKNVLYVEGGGRHQQLDICYGTKGKARPLIVWIHGGGWKSGSKSQNPALLLVAEGYAVASINYRLTDEAPWPAQIEDCKAAIRFLRANAARFNIDPTRIGAWGGSAGGHLAAMLGTSGDVADFETDTHAGVSSRVQAVCDWFGPTTFSPQPAVQPEINLKVKPRRGHEMVVALLGGAPEEKVDAARSASPITYATPDDPPFLIMHGELDETVPLAQSQLLEKTLRDAGVPVSLKVVKEAGHAGREWAQRDLLKKVRVFFDRNLKS